MAGQGVEGRLQEGKGRNRTDGNTHDCDGYGRHAARCEERHLRKESGGAQGGGGKGRPCGDRHGTHASLGSALREGDWSHGADRLVQRRTRQDDGGRGAFRFAHRARRGARNPRLHEGARLVRAALYGRGAFLLRAGLPCLRLRKARGHRGKGCRLGWPPCIGDARLQAVVDQ